MIVNSIATSGTGRQLGINTNFFNNYSAVNTYRHRPLPEGTEGISTDIWYANFNNLIEGKATGMGDYEDQTELDPIRGRYFSYQDNVYRETHDGEPPYATWGCIA